VFWGEFGYEGLGREGAVSKGFMEEHIYLLFYLRIVEYMTGPEYTVPLPLLNTSNCD
jgi:hypothetical protein